VWLDDYLRHGEARCLKFCSGRRSAETITNMAAALMNDNLHPFPDSPHDEDETAYPCKGCGEVRVLRYNAYGQR